MTTAHAVEPPALPTTSAIGPKWRIALDELIRTCSGNGIPFDWLVFDEGYGAVSASAAKP